MAWTRTTPHLNIFCHTEFWWFLPYQNREQTALRINLSRARLDSCTESQFLPGKKHSTWHALPSTLFALRTTGHTYFSVLCISLLLLLPSLLWGHVKERVSSPFKDREELCASISCPCHLGVMVTLGHRNSLSEEMSLSLRSTKLYVECKIQ